MRVLQMPWNTPDEHLEQQQPLRGAWVIERFTKEGSWVWILKAHDERYARRMFERAREATSLGAVRLLNPLGVAVSQLTMPGVETGSITP